MTNDARTLGQRWADFVTEFSGSWAFIFWFTGVTAAWIAINYTGIAWDPYPFLFLNWLLTMISTVQGPIILLSQNRQNDVDRANMADVLRRLDELKSAVDELRRQAT